MHFLRHFMGIWPPGGARVRYYEGLSQNFVCDHQVLFAYSVLRHILPCNHYMWALLRLKTVRNAFFTCFYVNLSVFQSGYGEGVAGFYDFGKKKKGLSTRFDVTFPKVICCQNFLQISSHGASARDSRSMGHMPYGFTVLVIQNI